MGWARLALACVVLAAAAPAPAHERVARDKAFDFAAPEPGSYRLPVIRAAADGAVLDVDGRPQRLHDALRGRITLLSFIYTRCSDARGCPLATATLHRLQAASRKDPALADNLRLISLSFDPAHDTPAVMAQHHGKQRGGAEWLELTTASEADLDPILRGYDQVVAKRPAGADGVPEVVGHQLRAYLIDRSLRVRNIYGADFLDARLLLADIRTLLAEAPPASP